MCIEISEETDLDEEEIAAAEQDERGSSRNIQQNHNCLITDRMEEEK